MIGALRGILSEKQAPHVLIETANGVSYELQASMATFYRLPAVGEAVVLHTHLIVREDAQLLFGFFMREERTLFRTLIKVNGIGPKVALAILSSIEPDAFVRCIMDQDSLSLTKIPGIGRKTAERLVIEMKDRCAEWETSGAKHFISTQSGVMNDALGALIALGYKPQEASRALSQVKQEGLKAEDLIRLALRGMVPC
ncbi:MAG: Holliday junction branch migration protein RuvA [Gammaproteobacteria bacterium]|nr:Holliday junction branch migration protein RuvA [Gammaproteobacteria bacterium]